MAALAAVSGSLSLSWAQTGGLGACLAGLATAALYKQRRTHSTDLAVLSWNIAAVNNNPFEYWITHSDPEYNKFMQAVQSLVDSPHGPSDLTVADVFPEALCEELFTLMRTHARFDGITEVRAFWTEDLKHRKIISGFLKDKSLGAKRLISMPDRLTNTMTTVSHGILCRPAVINAYAGDMQGIAEWWPQWRKFIFDMPIKLTEAQEGPLFVYGLFERISSKKYPALTAEDERLSLPLQVLCLAVFDAITVHLVNSASQKWHSLKMSICASLNSGKTEKCADLLANRYQHADVIMLQEAGSSFLRVVEQGDLHQHYLLLRPAQFSLKRDQNSIILVRKTRFESSSLVELTSSLEKAMPADAPSLAAGDLCVFACTSVSGQSYVFASFHGDTNGLATVPMIQKLREIARKERPEAILIVGLDANTYHKHKPGDKQGVREFMSECAELGLSTCWGLEPSNTTFNARTFLQPQLNKAVAFSGMASHSATDRNPKDHIVFDNKRMTTTRSEVVKDNTGEQRYDESIPFPTLSFPSDHGIILARLSSL